MAYLLAMRAEELLASTAAGLYCHIDPTLSVARALITHGHSDHARAGHGVVLATPETIDLMRLRYGENLAGAVQGVRSVERLTIGGVAVSFHPAGHILGSAQILVEAGGTGGAWGAGALRVVASGDYKDTGASCDPTCAPYEPIPCDVFITEATFALPVFRHGDPKAEIAKLLRSVALFPERAHLVGAYSLGKARRVIALLRQAGSDRPIYLHGAMAAVTAYYGRRIALGALRRAVDAGKDELAGAIALCPPSVLKDRWTRRFRARQHCQRFGPVREVVHDNDRGLVFEVAFEGLQRSAPAQVRHRHALSPHQPAAFR
jgi:putative mRNA 3-end processing factor